MLPQLIAGTFANNQCCLTDAKAKLRVDAFMGLPHQTDADRTVVIMCQEGYASSLAAASLISLGRRHTTDLDGGFAAWKAAGLPTRPPATS